MEKQLALDLIDFLYKSPTAYHSVKTIKEELDLNGFREIKESEKSNLQNEGKYYVIKNDSALIAFTIGNGDVEEDGFKINRSSY